MKPKDKGRHGDSLEGHGLSVSECPDAWEEIAELGGEAWWSLSTPAASPPTFLDWHAVPPTVRNQMLAWAIEQELVVRCKGYRVSIHDEDREEKRSMTFLDAKEARAEHAWLLDEYEGSADKAPQIAEFAGWKVTLKALRLLSRQQAALDEAKELVAILYCDANTSLDGIYWADEHDVAALSAPRAVIFPRALTRFQVKPIEPVIAREVHDYVPAFAPELVDEPGIGWVYRDGRVDGAVDPAELPDGRRSLLISEWSSHFRDQGHSVAALKWLRERFQVIVANGVGTIDEDGIGDIATCYWSHMMEKGLVDEMLDDDGYKLEFEPRADPSEPYVHRVVGRDRHHRVSP